jgi:hypothetical protein
VLVSKWLPDAPVCNQWHARKICVPLMASASAEVSCAEAVVLPTLLAVILVVPANSMGWSTPGIGPHKAALLYSFNTPRPRCAPQASGTVPDKALAARLLRAQCHTRTLAQVEGRQGAPHLAEAQPPGLHYLPLFRPYISASTLQNSPSPQTHRYCMDANEDHSDGSVPHRSLPERSA